MAYVITAQCTTCRSASCYAVCPAEAIGGGDLDQQMYIDPDLCIECGLCAEACPVNAIYLEEDLPEQWREFIAINRDYFRKLH
jgi:Fe-S-cluster-containing hydrogenase component 2